MIRTGKFPIALSLGALLLLAPAGQACGEFARMGPNCPMTERAAEPQPEMPCHEPATPEAECCLTAAVPGDAAALVTAKPKLDVPWVAVEAPAAWTRSAPDFEGPPPWLREPPPLDGTPRYARLSTYLL